MHRSSADRLLSIRPRTTSRNTAGGTSVFRGTNSRMVNALRRHSDLARPQRQRTPGCSAPRSCASRGTLSARRLQTAASCVELHRADQRSPPRPRRKAMPLKSHQPLPRPQKQLGSSRDEGCLTRACISRRDTSRIPRAQRSRLLECCWVARRRYRLRDSRADTQLRSSRELSRAATPAEPTLRATFVSTAQSQSR